LKPEFFPLSKKRRKAQTGIPIALSLSLKKEKKGFPSGYANRAAVQQHGKSKACTFPPIHIPYSFKIGFISNLLTWVDLQAHHNFKKEK